VLAQSYPNIELLVFDDGSVDNTAEMLASYGKQFYWESHSNIGQSATLNKGWKMSKGKIVSYLSADDALEVNAVEAAVECLQENDSAILAYGDYYLINAESEVIKLVNAPEFNYSEMVASIVVQPGPGVFFWRRGFKKVGGWDESLHQVPDYEYWLRLGLLGRFVRLPKPLAHYRVHEESQSYIEANIEKSEECVRVMRKYFENNKVPEDIAILEAKAKSMSHLIAVRFHLRAGRYNYAYRNIKTAWAWSSKAVFSIRMVQLLGNALLFRVKRILWR
jgi:glycosyltransferase involved in cell wall biosynthesis